MRKTTPRQRGSRKALCAPAHQKTRHHYWHYCIAGSGYCLVYYQLSKTPPPRDTVDVPPKPLEDLSSIDTSGLIRADPCHRGDAPDDATRLYTVVCHSAGTVSQRPARYNKRQVDTYKKDIATPAMAGRTEFNIRPTLKAVTQYPRGAADQVNLWVRRAERRSKPYGIH